MLLKKMRVGQAVKKGYNILNCQMTYAVEVFHFTAGAYQMLTKLPCHRLTVTTTLLCHFPHTFCFAPKMWHESMEVSHKHG